MAKEVIRRGVPVHKTSIWMPKILHRSLRTILVAEGVTVTEWARQMAINEVRAAGADYTEADEFVEGQGI